MKTRRTIKDILLATASADPVEEVTLEELAKVHGGSGMEGMPTPTPGKNNSSSSSSSSSSSTDATVVSAEPYTPPVSIPTPVSEPSSPPYDYFPSDFPMDGGTGPTFPEPGGDGGWGY